MSTQQQILKFAQKFNIKNTKLIQTGAFINNEWYNNTEEVFSVEDPGTGENVINVTNTPISVIEQGIKDADVAFKKFSKEYSGRQRGRILRKFYDLMMENADDLAIICTVENGKSLADSKGEVGYASSFFEWFAEEAPRIYSDNIPSAAIDKRIITSKQPIGVVGILTPWNFPIAMITRKLGAAFAAGCTTVIKPATETPLSALALAVLAEEAGFPKGALSIFPVDQKRTIEVGKLFCESPIIKKISFTGSTGVGKLLMSQSASTLKKLSFELGGNSPFIVFEDADIDVAVAAAVGCKLRQSGQTCICANRLYIHEAVYDEFASKFTEAVSKLTLGYGLDPNTTHGPLIHERAVEKVEHHIADAIEKGAKVLYGGKRRTDIGPYFHDLTILGDVSQDALVNKEETFGPLAPLIKFSSEEEVMRLANDTEYGLAGYFFSKDYARIFRVGENLHCGMIGANTGALGEASLPFGGIGWSGFGREGSKYGIDDYTVIKSLVIAGI
ncbi:hypothetical protein CANINC_001521 [Pichia inconspicua]|uniref:Succinate-semialdehyde dehydrogenase n=1 Tax=Pichia inconspicua TaxID=52247 RepID=A0A4T0X4N7_9ASCO|nr:hypothetical protein CANINC_001521 [[Candida] inconspicua]